MRVSHNGLSTEELLAEINRLREVAERAEARAADAARARDVAQASLEEEQCYGTVLRLPPLPPRHLDGRGYIDGTQYPNLSLVETIYPTDGGSVMHVAIEGDALTATSVIRASGTMVDLVIVQPDRAPKDDLHSFLANVSADLHSAKGALSPTGSVFLLVEARLVDRYTEIGNYIFGAENAHNPMMWKKNTNPTNTKNLLGKLMDSFYCILGWHGSQGAARPALDQAEGERLGLSDDKGKYRLALEQQVAKGDFGWSGSAVFDILGVSPKGGNSWKRSSKSVQQDIDNGVIEVRDGSVYRRVYEGESVRGFSGDITDQVRYEYDSFTMLDGPEFPSMATASKALTKKIGAHPLRGIVPVGVVKFLVRKFAPRGDETVLDFYAGSGTLLEAVSLQNAQDGGRRRAILVEQRIPMQMPDEVKSMMSAIIIPRARTVLPGDQGLHVFVSSSISTSKVKIARETSVAEGNMEKIMSSQPALTAISVMREAFAPTVVESASGKTVMVDHHSRKVVLVWGNARTVEASILGSNMLSEAKDISAQFPDYERVVYFADGESASSRTPSANAIRVLSSIPGWRMELPGMDYVRELESQRGDLIAARRTSTTSDYAALENRIRFGK